MTKKKERNNPDMHVKGGGKGNATILWRAISGAWGKRGAPVSSHSKSMRAGSNGRRSSRRGKKGRNIPAAGAEKSDGGGTEPDGGKTFEKLG